MVRSRKQLHRSQRGSKPSNSIGCIILVLAALVTSLVLAHDFFFSEPDVLSEDGEFTQTNRRARIEEDTFLSQLGKRIAMQQAKQKPFKVKTSYVNENDPFKEFQELENTREEQGEVQAHVNGKDKAGEESQGNERNIDTSFGKTPNELRKENGIEIAEKVKDEKIDYSDSTRKNSLKSGILNSVQTNPRDNFGKNIKSDPTNAGEAQTNQIQNPKNGGELNSVRKADDKKSTTHVLKEKLNDAGSQKTAAGGNSESKLKAVSAGEKSIGRKENSKEDDMNDEHEIEMIEKLEEEEKLENFGKEREKKILKESNGSKEKIDEGKGKENATKISTRTNENSQSSIMKIKDKEIIQNVKSTEKPKEIVNVVAKKASEKPQNVEIKLANSKEVKQSAKNVSRDIIGSKMSGNEAKGLDTGVQLKTKAIDNEVKKEEDKPSKLEIIEGKSNKVEYKELDLERTKSYSKNNEPIREGKISGFLKRSQQLLDEENGRKEKGGLNFSETGIKVKNEEHIEIGNAGKHEVNKNPDKGKHDVVSDSTQINNENKKVDEEKSEADGEKEDDKEEEEREEEKDSIDLQGNDAAHRKEKTSIDDDDGGDNEDDNDNEDKSDEDEVSVTGKDVLQGKFLDKEEEEENDTSSTEKMTSTNENDKFKTTFSNHEDGIKKTSLSSSASTVIQGNISKGLVIESTQSSRSSSKVDETHGEKGKNHNSENFSSVSRLNPVDVKTRLKDSASSGTNNFQSGHILSDRKSNISDSDERSGEESNLRQVQDNKHHSFFVVRKISEPLTTKEALNRSSNDEPKGRISTVNASTNPKSPPDEGIELSQKREMDATDSKIEALHEEVKKDRLTVDNHESKVDLVELEVTDEKVKREDDLKKTNKDFSVENVSVEEHSVKKVEENAQEKKKEMKKLSSQKKVDDLLGEPLYRAHVEPLDIQSNEDTKKTKHKKVDVKEKTNDSNSGTTESESNGIKKKSNEHLSVSIDAGTDLKVAIETNLTDETGILKKINKKVKHAACAIDLPLTASIPSQYPALFANFPLRYVEKGSSQSLRFGGSQTRRQKLASFQLPITSPIHCGFISDSNRKSPGFDVSDDDTEFFHTCQIVVVSAIFGNWDRIRLPQKSKMTPAGKRQVCYVMFVDEESFTGIQADGFIVDGDNKIGLWRIVLVNNLPYSDPRKNGKIPKLLPHRLFPNAKYSIWIDSKLRLVTDPLLLLQKFLWDDDHEYAISNHYDRHCVWDEVAQNKKLNKYNQTVIEEQFAEYVADGLTRFNESDPFAVLPSNVPEGSMIMRAHSSMANLFSCLWFNEVHRFTSRDQLSFAYTFLKLHQSGPPFLRLNMFKDCERRAMVKLFKHRYEEEEKLNQMSNAKSSLLTNSSSSKLNDDEKKVDLKGIDSVDYSTAQ